MFHLLFLIGVKQSSICVLERHQSCTTSRRRSSSDDAFRCQPKVFSVGTNNTPKYSFPACWNAVQRAKPTPLVQFPPCDGEFGSIVQRSEWRKNVSVQKAAHSTNNIQFIQFHSDTWREAGAKITSTALVCWSKNFSGKQIFTFQGKGPVRVEKAELWGAITPINYTDASNGPF